MEIMTLRQITPTYPGVTITDEVSISFEEGEVHAIVGENGAGKSTFIKTISGAVKPDSGAIVIDGKEYTHLDPSQALDIGIAVVYQELIQFDAMTVADNIAMGLKRSGKKLIVNDREQREDAQKYLDVFHCPVSPDARIRDLSVANRQIIELCKAFAKKAKIVIMDEPTAAITVEEQENLFKIIRDLKEHHVTVIYISHRLEEIFEICDRVTVLRDGKYVDTKRIDEIDKFQMIRMMVGRELSETYPSKTPASNEEVLEAEHLYGNGLKDIICQRE